MYMLSKYNIHDNPFCTLIKKSDDAWTHCVSCQKKIYEKLDNEPFWGMCYAGVEEYIFPIKADEVTGFISLSGYGIDSERAYKRISKVAKEYSLDSSQLKFAYDKKLISEIFHFLKFNHQFRIRSHPFRSVPSATSSF